MENKETYCISIIFKEDANGVTIPIISSINFNCDMADLDKLNDAISNVAKVMDQIKIKNAHE